MLSLSPLTYGQGPLYYVTLGYATVQGVSLSICVPLLRSKSKEIKTGSRWKTLSLKMSGISKPYSFCCTSPALLTYSNRFVEAKVWLN